MAKFQLKGYQYDVGPDVSKNILGSRSYLKKIFYA